MESIPAEALLEIFPPPMRDLAEQLRSVVRRAVPDAVERVRPGWRLIGYDVPIGRRTAYFAFVAPEVGHVHLGFEHGALMDDPEAVLLGRGVTKRVRWLTFREGDAVVPAAIEPLLREAVRIASMGRDERLARAVDRGGTA